MAPGNDLLLFWHFVYMLSHIVRMKLELILTFDSKHFCSAHLQQHGRRNSYLKSRVLYTVNGTSSFQSFYEATFILNQDQQLKLDIHVKSVRGMFVQIRMLSYVLIAKPGHMQNVLDLPIHNPHIDWICNWCCLPFSNYSDLGFNAESNKSNDFKKNPPLFRIKKEIMQISCQPMDKGHTTKPAVMRTIDPLLNREKRTQAMYF